MEERLYALADPNYNVVALADASGDVLERYRYDAYGTPTVLNPNFTVRAGGTQYAWQHLFTTRRRDPATGLMHYRNRDYHPQLGRFVTRDPVRVPPICTTTSATTRLHIPIPLGRTQRS